MRARTIAGKVVLMVLILWGITTLPALAEPLFEAQPTNLNPNLMSLHGVGGPILADDFIPASSGTIRGVEWWGSSAPSNFWELAFHTNNPSTNVPNIDDPFIGSKVKYPFVTATGVADDPNHPGIYHFTAQVAPLFAVSAGTEYWFTVANFVTGWTWGEDTLAPTVGFENFGAVRSTGIGPDGGPHSGPWVRLSPETDLAFRLQPVPEPATMLLLGSGLIGLAGYARKRFKK